MIEQVEPFALISDIHSNTEALKRTVERIRELGIKKIVNLGDTIGYGPEPRQCLEIVIDVCEWSLLGNHDSFPIGLTTLADFNIYCRESTCWTKKQVLKRGWGWKSASFGPYLKTLSPEREEDGVLYVHGAPTNPLSDYLLREDTYTHPDEAEKLPRTFEAFEQVMFCGHTHRPGIIVPDGDRFKWISFNNCNGVYRLEEGVKAAINVGSVGQPRDGDRRACFVVFDGEKAELHRVKYDYRKTRDLIYANKKIENEQGDRLSVGK